MSEIRLRNCSEELLKLALQCRIDQTLEIDAGLSEEFCSRLLVADLPSDSFEGVPAYPLYKRLAYSLQQFLKSKTFCKEHCKMPIVGVENSLNQSENQWKKLILEKGSEIDNILKNVGFELHVEEPYFSQMKGELKTIDVRCEGDKRTRIEPGSLILYNKCLLFKVQDVHRYDSVSTMLMAEGIAKVFPGVESIKEGLEMCRKFEPEEKENSNGVVAICISKVTPQPYVYMAEIVSGLSYRGIQGLLCLANTAGTVENALPPPRSALLSSFLSPYKINVKGSVLSRGARALAKHVHRSSHKYWGVLDGNDDTKNSLAFDVITRLITKCRWLNVHIIQPHGEVFEIRDAEGYGARWSSDASKFIGFLEPYSENGHSAKWKH